MGKIGRKDFSEPGGLDEILEERHMIYGVAPCVQDRRATTTIRLQAVSHRVACSSDHLAWPSNHFQYIRHMPETSQCSPVGLPRRLATRSSFCRDYSVRKVVFSRFVVTGV